MSNQLKSLKQHFNTLTSPQKAIETYNDNSEFRGYIKDIDSKHPGKGKLRLLEQAIGQKFISSQVPEILDPQTPIKVRIRYAESVLADDLLSAGIQFLAPYLKDVISYAGPKVIDWLYGFAKRKFGQYRNVEGHGSGTGYKAITPGYESDCYGMV